MAGALVRGAIPWCTRLVGDPVDEVPVEDNNLRATCTARVRAVLQVAPLPVPWDVDVWIDRLERVRGRGIDLCEVPWSVGESTGAWQARPDHDVIAYPSNTGPLHQDHVILHEIGHVISEHRGECVLSVADAQRRAPDLAPTALAHLLDRVSVGSEEREAEMIAILLLAHIAGQDRRRPARRPADRQVAATLERVTTTFDDLL